MTDEEFRQRKQALDRQLEAGIALLRNSHRTQVQALEQLWMVSRNAPAAPAEPVVPPKQPPAPDPPARSPRRAAGELVDEVLRLLDRLPETFDKNDVCRALGYTPDRASLFKALRTLEEGDRIEVRELGGGRRPTVYRRKPGSQDHP
ncbi:MAG TPA: hypothetical protein VGX68_17335 [Thermoanaerobaculia bacterium]|jgi:hypothetical protein|nr:hypothetical protein [Thermoanaerobaculia bacterium]